MRFKKGEPRPTGAGRKKGSDNIVNRDIRKAFQNLIEDNLDQIKLDLMMLEPKDRLIIVAKLAEFVVPKMSTQTINTGPDLKNALKQLMADKLPDVE
jgi:hypothetical protein